MTRVKKLAGVLEDSLGERERGVLTVGRRPGRKLKGIPMAMIPRAMSLELAGKTGLRMWVEKYMTGGRTHQRGARGFDEIIPGEMPTP